MFKPEELKGKENVEFFIGTAELKDPEHIVVWYIDHQGNIISVPNGKYNPSTGKVTFTTTQYSKYVVHR